MTAFGKAFAAARKAGKDTFTWNGNLYTTKLASEGSAPKNVPVPADRPQKDGPPEPTVISKDLPPPVSPEDAAKAEASDNPGVMKSLGRLMISGLFPQDGTVAVKQSDVAASPASAPAPQTPLAIQGPVRDQHPGMGKSDPGAVPGGAIRGNIPDSNNDSLIQSIMKFLAADHVAKSGGGGW